MRAAVVERAGEPPRVVDRAVPLTGDGELRVTVTAVPITPLDLLCASGTSYFGLPAFPYVPGVQGVGRLADGTPVWFPTDAGMKPGDGSMAEQAVVPAAAVARLPADVDHRLVAALGLSAVAAWHALTDRGGLAAGEQVLVLGAGGVVGQAAIQIAKLHGARRVVAAARSVAARERAHRAGADVVVAVHPRDDVTALARRFGDAAGGPVDLVLDPVFGLPGAAALRTLGVGGRLVNLGSAAADTAPLDSATLRSRSLRVLGYTNAELSPERTARTISEIARHAAAGRLTVAYEHLPLEAATDAWHRQATGDVPGRIVLTAGFGRAAPGRAAGMIATELLDRVFVGEERLSSDEIHRRMVALDPPADVLIAFDHLPEGEYSVDEVAEIIGTEEPI
ncbi:quinone oxidoreductase family protein [Asanoa siamensis]|uniref:NADPH:quinone reductase n=1 Tax=Asanoa siamensis TaxID=926357 RepID=A0ABQ4CQC1_9ACTN|nr:zinc-binding alcohol dehydrogenase family protein [Asanoa siamensis]GIF73460.1 NADPH:quinone reductase [Asanoa siamensis]